MARLGRFVDTDASEAPVIKPLESAQPTALQGYRAAMLGQRVDSDVQLLFAVQLPDRMEMFGFGSTSQTRLIWPMAFG